MIYITYIIYIIYIYIYIYISISKQAVFAQIQTAGHSDNENINDTEIRLIVKMDPLTLLDVKIFG